MIGYVRGGIHGNHAAWEQAEERALGYYRSTAFPPATCMQQIAAAVYWGPTPVAPGIERCTELLDDKAAGHFGRAAVMPFLGGLHAQAGDFARRACSSTRRAGTLDRARRLCDRVVHCGTVRADVELLAGELEAAEATLREQCEFFERTQIVAHLAVRAAKLAEALYRQGRFEEAEQWAGVSRSHASSDDQSALLVLGPVEAKLLARRGEALRGSRPRRGDRAPRGRHRRAESDRLCATCACRCVCAADLGDEAQRAIEEAIDLFERKGNAVAATQARDA